MVEGMGAVLPYLALVQALGTSGGRANEGGSQK